MTIFMIKVSVFFDFEIFWGKTDPSEFINQHLPTKEYFEYFLRMSPK